MSKLSLFHSKLIGAPHLFPLSRLHHSVVVSDLDGTTNRYVLDVIPRNATDPRVLAAMLAGKTVDANARCKPLSSTGLADAHLAKSCIISDVDPSSLAELGREFQNEYYHSSATPTISLYSNNCMAFASALYEHLSSTSTSGRRRQ